MTPQDHSDTTLLVWSDWLEENGEEQKAHELREEIANPPARRTISEYSRYGGSIVGGVGVSIGVDVGSGHGNAVGGNGGDRGGVGGSTVGSTVGSVSGVLGTVVGGAGGYILF